jgi:wobble nucleotide-excising tRNase
VFSDLKNSSSNVLIANAMRNIIEYFSSVVCGDRELSSVKGKLIGDDMKLSPLFRYIDRGSHSDSYNVSMFSALDFPDYQRALKLFFSEIGYEDHYNVMSARYF